MEEFRKQIDLRKPENYGFASMAAVAYAHIIAHVKPYGVALGCSAAGKCCTSTPHTVANAIGQHPTGLRGPHPAQLV